MKEHPLKTYRDERGLTMAAFARIAGTSESTISRVESGQLQPTFPLLRRLVDATDGSVSADQLLRAEAA